jgi:hypothetical protein
MSADYWGVCDAFKELVKEHLDLYGTQDPDEWMKDELSLKSKVPDEEDFSTFREDYEWYTKDGYLHGEFSGWCTKCNLGLDYNMDPVRFYIKGQS